MVTSRGFQAPELVEDRAGADLLPGVLLGRLGTVPRVVPIFEVKTGTESHGVEAALDLGLAGTYSESLPGSGAGLAAVGNGEGPVLAVDGSLRTGGHQPVANRRARRQTLQVGVHIIEVIIREHPGAAAEDLDLSQSPVLLPIAGEQAELEVTGLGREAGLQSEGEVGSPLPFFRQVQGRHHCILTVVRRRQDLHLLPGPFGVLMDLDGLHRDLAVQGEDELLRPVRPAPAAPGAARSVAPSIVELGRSFGRAFRPPDQPAAVGRIDQGMIPVDEPKVVEVQRSRGRIVDVHGGRQVKEVAVDVGLGLIDGPVGVAGGALSLERRVVPPIGPLRGIVQQAVVDEVPTAVQQLIGEGMPGVGPIGAPPSRLVPELDVALALRPPQDFGAVGLPVVAPGPEAHASPPEIRIAPAQPGAVRVLSCTQGSGPEVLGQMERADPVVVVAIVPARLREPDEAALGAARVEALALQPTRPSAETLVPGLVIDGAETRGQGRFLGSRPVLGRKAVFEVGRGVTAMGMNAAIDRHRRRAQGACGPRGHVGKWSRGLFRTAVPGGARNERQQQELGGKLHLDPPSAPGSFQFPVPEITAT